MPAESKWWQPQDSQALVQNLPVDANAVRQQAPVSLAQIRHESALMGALQNPHTTHDGQALGPAQSPGRPFVNDREISPQRAGQEDGGEFAGAQRAAGPQGGEAGGVRRGVNFNPVCPLHRRGGGPSSAAHNDFLMHLAGNMDAAEEQPQQVEAADAGERDEGEELETTITT